MSNNLLETLVKRGYLKKSLTQGGTEEARALPTQTDIQQVTQLVGGLRHQLLRYTVPVSRWLTQIIDDMNSNDYTRFIMTSKNILGQVHECSLESFTPRDDPAIRLAIAGPIKLSAGPTYLPVQGPEKKMIDEASTRLHARISDTLRNESAYEIQSGRELPTKGDPQAATHQGQKRYLKQNHRADSLNRTTIKEMDRARTFILTDGSLGTDIQGILQTDVTAIDFPSIRCTDIVVAGAKLGKENFLWKRDGRLIFIAGVADFVRFHSQAQQIDVENMKRPANERYEYDMGKAVRYLVEKVDEKITAERADLPKQIVWVLPIGGRTDNGIHRPYFAKFIDLLYNEIVRKRRSFSTILIPEPMSMQTDGITLLAPASIYAIHLIENYIASSLLFNATSAISTYLLYKLSWTSSVAIKVRKTTMNDDNEDLAIADIQANVNIQLEDDTNEYYKSLSMTVEQEHEGQRAIDALCFNDHVDDKVTFYLGYSDKILTEKIDKQAPEGSPLIPDTDLLWQPIRVPEKMQTQLDARNPEHHFTIQLTQQILQISEIEGPVVLEEFLQTNLINIGQHFDGTTKRFLQPSSSVLTVQETLGQHRDYWLNPPVAVVTNMTPLRVIDIIALLATFPHEQFMQGPLAIQEYCTRQKGLTYDQMRCMFYISGAAGYVNLLKLIIADEPLFQSYKRDGQALRQSILRNIKCDEKANGGRMTIVELSVALGIHPAMTRDIIGRRFVETLWGTFGINFPLPPNTWLKNQRQLFHIPNWLMGIEQAMMINFHLQIPQFRIVRTPIWGPIADPNDSTKCIMRDKTKGPQILDWRATPSIDRRTNFPMTERMEKQYSANEQDEYRKQLKDSKNKGIQTRKGTYPVDPWGEPKEPRTDYIPTIEQEAPEPNIWLDRGNQPPDATEHCIEVDRKRMGGVIIPLCQKGMKQYRKANEHKRTALNRYEVQKLKENYNSSKPIITTDLYVELDKTEKQRQAEKRKNHKEALRKRAKTNTQTTASPEEQKEEDRKREINGRILKDLESSVQDCENICLLLQYVGLPDQDIIEIPRMIDELKKIQATADPIKMDEAYQTFIRNLVWYHAQTVIPWIIDDDIHRQPSATEVNSMKQEQVAHQFMRLEDLCTNCERMPKTIICDGCNSLGMCLTCAALHHIWRKNDHVLRWITTQEPIPDIPISGFYADNRDTPFNKRCQCCLVHLPTMICQNEECKNRGRDSLCRFCNVFWGPHHKLQHNVVETLNKTFKRKRQEEDKRMTPQQKAKHRKLCNDQTLMNGILEQMDWDPNPQNTNVAGTSGTNANLIQLDDDDDQVTFIKRPELTGIGIKGNYTITQSPGSCSQRMNPIADFRYDNNLLSEEPMIERRSAYGNIVHLHGFVEAKFKKELFAKGHSISSMIYGTCAVPEYFKNRITQRRRDTNDGNGSEMHSDDFVRLEDESSMDGHITLPLTRNDDNNHLDMGIQNRRQFIERRETGAEPSYPSEPIQRRVLQTTSIHNRPKLEMQQYSLQLNEAASEDMRYYCIACNTLQSYMETPSTPYELIDCEECGEPTSAQLCIPKSEFELNMDWWSGKRNLGQTIAMLGQIMSYASFIRLIRPYPGPESREVRYLSFHTWDVHNNPGPTGLSRAAWDKFMRAYKAKNPSGDTSFELHDYMTIPCATMITDAEGKPKQPSVILRAMDQCIPRQVHTKAAELISSNAQIGTISDRDEKLINGRYTTRINEGTTQFVNLDMPNETNIHIVNINNAIHTASGALDISAFDLMTLSGPKSDGLNITRDQFGQYESVAEPENLMENERLNTPVAGLCAGYFSEILDTKDQKLIQNGTILWDAVKPRTTWVVWDIRKTLATVGKLPKDSEITIIELQMIISFKFLQQHPEYQRMNYPCTREEIIVALTEPHNDFDLQQSWFAIMHDENRPKFQESADSKQHPLFNQNTMLKDLVQVSLTYWGKNSEAFDSFSRINLLPHDYNAKLLSGIQCYGKQFKTTSNKERAHIQFAELWCRTNCLHRRKTVDATQSPKPDDTEVPMKEPEDDEESNCTSDKEIGDSVCSAESEQDYFQIQPGNY